MKYTQNIQTQIYKKKIFIYKINKLFFACLFYEKYIQKKQQLIQSSFSLFVYFIRNILYILIKKYQ
ncbi:hypothetical protein pb186bvf_017363 [Paramecium bursaria]